jgi:1-phosphofructokinase
VIVTLTPNPSIDRTLTVERLDRGGLVRATAATVEAAGKGVNVARALHAHGVATLAIVPLSTSTAPRFTGLIDDGVPLLPVPVDGPIRENVSIVEPDGTVTKVNEPGPRLAASEVDAMLAAAAAAGAAWLVGCGSLPPGAPPDFYARLTALGSPDRPVAIDASGEALRRCVAARPALLKPNRTELEEVVGRPLTTLGAVRDAAGELVVAGVGAVLASLGRDGALLVDQATAIHGEANVDNIASTVGAGDALLAGFLAGGAEPAALAQALAWSVAAVRSPTTRMPRVMDADRAAVRIHPAIVGGRQLAD